MSLKGKSVSRKRSSGSYRRIRQTSLSGGRRFGGIITAAILVAAATVLLTAAVSSWQFFNKPLVFAQDGSSPQFFWNGSSSLRVLVVFIDDFESTKVKELYFLSVNPGLGNSSLVSLNSLTAGDSSLFVGQHSRSFANQIRRRISFPLERYLVLDDSGKETLLKYFNGASWDKCFDLVKTPALIKSVSLVPSQAKTDLSLSEIVSIFRFMNSLRSSEFFIYDLDYVRDYRPVSLYDQNLAGGGLRINILNGTPIPGLASQASRILENLGANIMEVGNAEKSDYRETVLVGEDTDSSAASFLASAFRVGQKRGPLSTLEKRADLTLILGLDNSF